MNYEACRLCPRQCAVDRTAGQRGFCGCPDVALVAKTMIHRWEEPVLAGEGGSGAIFFGGCTLGCRYCQNRAISGGPVGIPMDSARLRQAMEDLIAQGAENIDLVTPTHFLPTILPALTPRLPVPVVYNCGGYERAESLKSLEGLVDIYLPDLKYATDELGQKYSGAPDYFTRASAAILEMVRQTGPARYTDDGMMKSGTLVRHLILPGNTRNSIAVLRWLHDHLPENPVSLMSQYVPCGRAEEFPEINRTITRREYEKVRDVLFELELDGYMQGRSAAKKDFIPPFSLEGLDGIGKGWDSSRDS